MMNTGAFRTFILYSKFLLLGGIEDTIRKEQGGIRGAFGPSSGSGYYLSGILPELNFNDEITIRNFRAGLFNKENTRETGLLGRDILNLFDIHIQKGIHKCTLYYERMTLMNAVCLSGEDIDLHNNSYDPKYFSSDYFKDLASSLGIQYESDINRFVLNVYSKYTQSNQQVVQGFN